MSIEIATRINEILFKSERKYFWEYGHRARRIKQHLLDYKPLLRFAKNRSLEKSLGNKRQREIVFYLSVPSLCALDFTASFARNEHCLGPVSSSFMMTGLQHCFLEKAFRFLNINYPPPTLYNGLLLSVVFMAQEAVLLNLCFFTFVLIVPQKVWGVIWNKIKLDPCLVNYKYIWDVIATNKTIKILEKSTGDYISIVFQVGAQRFMSGDKRVTALRTRESKQHTQRLSHQPKLNAEWTDWEGRRVCNSCDWPT